MYFRDCDVADDKKVMKATLQISNKVVSDWYHPDYERFDNMDWDDFTATVCARFLLKGWALQIYSDLFATKQAASELYSDFILNVEHLNSYLCNTEYHQSEDALRGILIANMCPNLWTAIGDPAIMQVTDYVDWKTFVAAANERRLRNVEMINTLIVTCNNASRTQSTSKSFAKGPSLGAYSSLSSSQALPKLMPVEKQLLNDHQGCYKCRHFYAGHLSGGCPNGFPKADSYTPLTEAMAAKARATHTGKENIKPRTVASVDVNATNSDDALVAAVGVIPLAATTGVLGSGSDSEDSD
ncbi:hypothetical protein C8T65DRAFT_747470 [Cerioporus squamosus]|nr:hypothetical protein C8T65DRAFT_747470 [Cerioporus squamosus]